MRRLSRWLDVSSCQLGVRDIELFQRVAYAAFKRSQSTPPTSQGTSSKLSAVILKQFLRQLRMAML